MRKEKEEINEEKERKRKKRRIIFGNGGLYWKMKWLSEKSGIIKEEREGIRGIKGIRFPSHNLWAKQDSFLSFLQTVPKGL